MTMKVDIRHDLKQLAGRLDRIQKRQVPFAASQALNDTAFDIRKNTVERLWPASVNVKKRGFARVAFRVQKSNKRNLEAAVFDRLDREFLPRQIKGGNKVPYSGSHIAIPTRNALTSTGRIKKAARLSNPALFKMTFRRTNEPGLWIRTRKGLQLMYVLKPRVPVPKHFPFYANGIKIAQRKFPRNFYRRFARALRTARWYS